jgi:hypothetical protein
MWIMEKSQDLRDDERDDDCDRRPIRKKLTSMVVSYVESNRGEVGIEY